MTAVENKVSNVINLIIKTDYDAKMSDIENKSFTKSDYNKFRQNILDVKVKEKELMDKSALPGYINNADLNKKVSTLAMKVDLKSEQDKII